jgi:putative hydrolase of the HAD superfamily
LSTKSLLPKETLFIDDTLENIDAAKVLGIKTWHLQVGQEDILVLNNKLSNA